MSNPTFDLQARNTPLYAARLVQRRVGDTDASLDIAITRLARQAELDAVEIDALQRFCGPALKHRVGADLGDDSDISCRFLLSGWACRIRETPWGDRQILAFLLPGDAIGLSSTPGMGGLYRVIALTRGVSVDASELRQQIRAEPHAYPGLMRASLQWERGKATRMLEHMARLGCATAAQAMAHLLLELRSRMSDVGMLHGTRFPMPLSQETLHEALGITPTQVYRVLTQLRRDQLIALNSGWVDIPDPAALAHAAGLEAWKA